MYLIKYVVFVIVTLGLRRMVPGCQMFFFGSHSCQFVSLRTLCVQLLVTYEL